MTILFIKSLAAVPRDRWSGRTPATAGEWTVTGAFRFSHRDPASLMGRERSQFHSSWLGLDSFQPCLHAVVTPTTPNQLEQILRRLAAHLLDAWELPSPQAAVELAAEEIEFARTLADHPSGTVLALEREFNEQGLIERTRVVAAPG